MRLNKSYPDDIDGIVDTIRQILLTGQIQSLTLRLGEPITYERLMVPGEELAAKDSTEGFAELTPFEVVRNVPMEEFSYADYNDDDSTAHEKIMWAYMHVEHAQWMVTHILLHPDTKFWHWLGLAKGAARDIKHFFNARVEYDRNVPDDVYILCGASTRHATIAEIGCSIKCSIE